ncbi:MAG: DUF3574 domain-containing protein [Parvibaculum sp.]
MRRFAFIFLFLFVFTGCGHAAEPVGTIQTTLYFGLDLADGGRIDEEDWSDFLASVVTPLFPDGFTVIDAYGQWRDPVAANAPVLRERTKIVIIVHRATGETKAAISEIKAIYRSRFAQKSVFHTETPARVVE